MLEGIQSQPTWDNIYEACEGNQTNFNMKLFYINGNKNPTPHNICIDLAARK